MKLFQMIMMISALWLEHLVGQVNTESMRADNLSLGIQQKMDLSFAYISGTSEIMILRGDYRMDYYSKSNWHVFFLVKYDRAFEKSQVDFSNKGFGHLRVINLFRPRIHIEGFLQKEFNYFIDLENRELIGGGLRINPFEKFFIGIGAMNETENYQNTIIYEEQSFIKSTNYLNYSVQFAERVTIENILYYQFKLDTMDHYRILWDSKLSFQGSDWLSFHINCQYRYDISGINPKGSSYFEITNGLSFHF